VYSIEEILEATNIILNKNLSTNTQIKAEPVKIVDKNIKLSLLEIDQLNNALSVLTKKFIYSSTDSLTSKISKNN
jgi:hypothetical protein